MHNRIYISFICLIMLISCEKETENLSFTPASDYFPLIKGKNITYQIDSSVYLNLGTKKQINTSIIREAVDSASIDNAGRLTFKITRSRRQKDDTTKWNPINTYLVARSNETIEVIEENQRYIKLVSPVIAGTKWKGNAKINTTGNPALLYLDNWDYTYTGVGSPSIFNNRNFPDCLTVMQQNDTIGNPANKNFYFEINYAKEIYARQIGLIFKEIIHEIWQPSNGNNSAGYYESGSFGLKFTIISHN